MNPLRLLLPKEAHPGDSASEPMKTPSAKTNRQKLTDDIRIRGLRQASCRCIFDVLNGECEGDAKTIVRRLRQAVSFPEDSSNKYELKVIEGFLLSLQDVPEEEIAGLVTPVRSGEALSEVDSRRNEIDLLRRRLYHNESVISALSKLQYKEEVLARVDAGQGVDAISQWLEHAVPPKEGAASDAVNTGVPLPEPRAPQNSGTVLPSVSEWFPDKASGSSGDEKSDQQNLPSTGNKKQSQSTGTDFPPEVLIWTANMASYFRVSPRILSQQIFSGAADQNFMDHMSTPLQMSEMTPRTWTSVTQDMNLVQHLLALYFCWEYPIFATIHKEYFLADFLSGRQKYCSAGLVNAILALGCLLSSKAGSDRNPDDLRQHSIQPGQHTSLRGFVAAGAEVWQERRKPVLRRTEYAVGCRNGPEQGRSRRRGGARGCINYHILGAFTLNNTWALVMGLLPLTSRAPLLPPRPPMHLDIEASPWAPYPTEDANPMQHPFQQVSNTQSVFRCFCEISQLAHNAAYLTQTPNHPVTSSMLLYTYNQYLDWYGNIPEALRLGTNFTPPVFLVHIYYHSALLLLFRPFIRLRIDKSPVIPRDVCTEATDAVRRLVRSYSQLYGLQRSPSFLPYLTLLSTTMHLTIATVKGNESSATTATAQSAMLTDDVQHVIATVPLNLQDLARAVGRLAAQGKISRSELAPDVTDALCQGISDLTDMMQSNCSAKEALDTLQHLYVLWTDGGGPTEAQQQQPQSLLSFSFHVQGSSMPPLGCH
ncbi:uncharacterized protein PG998_003000 [Apiospora kogelbergensis]|uniref:uncharacterized protein n=1 Tax=Apiospora kogelbergensis TaxID=1337665 RepID=UPI00313114B6